MKNSARGSVDPFIVMDVMEAASKIEKAGHDVIHLEVGQPGTSAPILAKERAIDSLSASTLGYTVALGIPSFPTNNILQSIRKLYAKQLS